MKHYRVAQSWESADITVVPRTGARLSWVCAATLFLLGAGCEALEAGSTLDSAGSVANVVHASSELFASATWFAGLNDSNEPAFNLVPIPTLQPLNDVTIRQVAHISLGGDSFRIRFSNEYGLSPITFSKVHVAKSVGGASIDPKTDVAVTFNNASTVTIEPKTEVWSDDISLPVASFDDIAVTVYVPDSADFATEHRFSQRNSYVAFGDWTTQAEVNSLFQQTTEASFWMNEIDVLRTEPADVVVAFGDSITDGFNSTLNANLRYPDQLSKLVLSSPEPGRAQSVVNAGIGGNRWIFGGAYGPAGSDRFERDALGIAGIRDVVILLGINDIGFGTLQPDEAVTVGQLTAAMAKAVMRARRAGVRVFLGTLAPFGECPYYTDAGEALRQASNAWIRANVDVDKVIDFDGVLRDPKQPTMLKSHYDSGDHLHPSDAGYAAMAEEVDRALKL